MTNSVILEVTNDKYEFVVNMYDTTKQLAKKLNISQRNAMRKVCPSSAAKKKKTKYVRVWLNKEII